VREKESDRARLAVAGIELVTASRRALRSRQRRALFAGLLLVPQLAGCYTTRPLVGRDPSPGENVVLTISDQGRVELGDRLGVRPYRVQGRLADRTSEAFTINVSTIRGVEGGLVTWSGEPVSFSRSAVAQVEERKVSTWRSVLVAGATVGLVALFVAGIDEFFGGGSTGDRPGGGDPDPT